MGMIREQDRMQEELLVQPPQSLGSLAKPAFRQAVQFVQAMTARSQYPADSIQQEWLLICSSVGQSFSSVASHIVTVISSVTPVGSAQEDSVAVARRTGA